MSDPSQRCEAALALHRQGRLDEAERLYRGLLADEPAHFDTLHLLGILEGQRCHFTESAELIGRATAIKPEAPAPHANLGNALHALGEFERARDSYQRALDLQPGNLSALMGQGRAYWSLGRLGDAVRCYDEALKLDAGNAECWRNRGDILLATGSRAEGIASLRRAITCGADPEPIAFVLSSIDPEEGAAVPASAPVRYVTDLFDSYAERFDRTLVGTLGYRTPELLAAMIDAACRRNLDVLDLGCGTGLCGPLLKPRARKLVGVDLSENMLVKARERSIYDELVCAEITAYLAPQRKAFDLVVAADVFTYIGDLTQVFAGVSRALRAKGCFAFSVEACEGEDYELPVTRRYRHSRAYLERCADACGFAIERMEAGVLRQNDGADVEGTLALLRRVLP